MPYDGEQTGYEGTRRIARSNRVEELLAKQSVRAPRGGRAPSGSLETVSPSDLGADSFGRALFAPKEVIAIDGSYSEQRVREGFPGAEVAFVTVSSVKTDSGKRRLLSEAGRPVSPSDLQETVSKGGAEFAVPGHGISYDGEPTSMISFRHFLYDALKGAGARGAGETLLDTYEAVLSRAGEVTHPCPYEKDDQERAFERGLTFSCKKGGEHEAVARGRRECGCATAAGGGEGKGEPPKKYVYSTDAMCLHEKMRPYGTNRQLYSEVMLALERLWALHLLRAKENRDGAGALARTAVILDGPIAAFFPPEINRGFIRELRRLSREARQAAGRPLLVAGVKKTGLFADHFQMLDTKPSGREGKMPSGEARLIGEEYVKRNILSAGAGDLGNGSPKRRNTFFGRHLFYKTTGGHRVTASLPYYDAFEKGRKETSMSEYARLGDVLSLFEQSTSHRYPHALAPLVRAHESASISENLAEKVLGEKVGG